jgi:hypothetical protein
MFSEPARFWRNRGQNWASGSKGGVAQKGVLYVNALRKGLYLHFCS